MSEAAKKEDITVRPATKVDCAAIRVLIQELADYEKMPDGPKIGADVLARDGFGEEPLFSCSVAALPDGALVGYVLYLSVFAWRGRAVHMEDLYVSPRYRGRGVGMRLWGAVVQNGLSLGAFECRLNVLDWNAPSLAFYNSKGARDTSEDTGYLLFRMEAETMTKFAGAVEPLPEGVTIRTATVTDLCEVNTMQRELAEHMGIPNELTLTEADLVAAVSASPPLCHFLVASNASGRLLGFAMFYFMYSTWEGVSVYLEDIYVKKEERCRGLGQLLWQAVVQRGLEHGCRRCDFVTVRSNTAAIAYYEKRGARDLTSAEGWHSLVLPKAAMVTLAAGLT